MSEENAHEQGWSIWINIFILAFSIAMFASAGSAEISGNEVGAGFFPKIAAVALGLLAITNLIFAVRVESPVLLMPRSIFNLAFVVFIGFLGMMIFHQAGLAIALFFLFLTLLVLSERKFTWQIFAIALASMFIFHGFFVGGLGVFDPAGNLIDLRWITPW